MQLLLLFLHFHNYVPENWLNVSKSNTRETSDDLLLDMPCNPTTDQILFVMVRKTASLPIFDMQFNNYGYNRRIWTEELRYAGYEMKVFRDGFLVEVPHMK